MAGSLIPRPTTPSAERQSLDIPAGWLGALRACWPRGADDSEAKIGVALSAGPDSVALLLAAVHCWPARVEAIHVHHGLQAAGDVFVDTASQLCDSLNVHLSVCRLDGRVPQGRSVEEWARTERYKAVADQALALGLDAVLLGQHADDQAETILLALSRGAGLPGLAAMPASFERHGMRFLRPWLALEKHGLRGQLDDWGVSYVDDPANADEGLVRSRIRRRLAPALGETFPGYQAMFARSARHAAQAASLLDEVGREDLERMGGVPVIKALQPMSEARMANVLRHWLRDGHQVQASAAQMQELIDQVRACVTRGHNISMRVAGGLVVRSAGALVYRETV